jgi:hypothetical protein
MRHPGRVIGRRAPGSAWYGPHLRSMFGQAGRHVVRVLNGGAPQEIPVERPTQFSLLITRRPRPPSG